MYIYLNGNYDDKKGESTPLTGWSEDNAITASITAIEATKNGLILNAVK